MSIADEVIKLPVAAKAIIKVISCSILREARTAADADGDRTPFLPDFANHLNYQLSTTNYQLPTTNYQLPTTNYQLSTTNYQLPTINYQLPTTNYQLPTTNYQLPTTNL